MCALTFYTFSIELFYKKNWWLWLSSVKASFANSRAYLLKHSDQDYTKYDQNIPICIVIYEILFGSIPRVRMRIRKYFST